MSDLSADEFQPEVVLPLHIFFYRVDQIAHMLDCSVSYLERAVLYYQGRDYGRRPMGRMRAVNIAAPDEKPEWRVSEEDFVIWLRNRGITFHEIRRPSRVYRGKKAKAAVKKVVSKGVPPVKE